MKNLYIENCFFNGELGRVFSWLARIGSGRKFGSCPIGWYQVHNCHAIKILENLGASRLRCKYGIIQTKKNNKWINLISSIELFQQADNLSRK